MEPVIKQINTHTEKSDIARKILLALPDWFGIPESTEEYITQCQNKPFWAAYSSTDTDNVLGFISLRETSPYTAEIYVMGVLPEYHHKGIGRKLFAAFENYAREQNYSFLQVKTVQEGHYKEYDLTNLFYRGVGFQEFECFPTLWDEHNPCQILIKAIARN